MIQNNRGASRKFTKLKMGATDDFSGDTPKPNTITEFQEFNHFLCILYVCYLKNIAGELPSTSMLIYFAVDIKTQTKNIY